jgi:hypothetical protein
MHISVEDYVLGLADLTGELMRKFYVFDFVRCASTQKHVNRRALHQHCRPWSTSTSRRNMPVYAIDTKRLQYLELASGIKKDGSHEGECGKGRSW